MTPGQLNIDDMDFGVGDLVFFCFTSQQERERERERERGRKSIKVFLSFTEQTFNCGLNLKQQGQHCLRIMWSKGIFVSETGSKEQRN